MHDLRPESAGVVATSATETPFRRGGPGPLYWSTYGYSNTTNTNIPEDVWKANVDWVATALAPSGYDMVCTDGWIDDTQDVTRHGYIKSCSDAWEHDWAWWSDYLEKRGLRLGVYYNPLWVTKSAVSDTSIRVAGRPDLAVADVVNPGDWFDGGGQIQWVDATKDGAEDYVKGYVRYFRDLGAVFLRIDFLSYYETGYDQSEGTIGRAHGRDSYVKALSWMREAAGPDMQLSLVMPNLFDHAAAERQYGDLVRIDNDVSFGQWFNLSEGRQTWQPIWSQWDNPFQGFTGFSDVSGPGQLILDGDPLQITSFTRDQERQSVVTLFTMAGAAQAVADQYDTIDGHEDVLTNPEVLALRTKGLVGKPISLSSHAYEWDQTSRDSERWIGQLADGSWAVGLFFRADKPATATRTVDFASTLGLTRPAHVRDLWAQKDLGLMTSWSVDLAPHACSLVLVTPQEEIHHQAEVGAFAGTAHFDNIFEGHSGLGYVTGLDTEGSSVTVAVSVARAGTHTVRCRVANGSGAPATLGVAVRDPRSGVVRATRRATVAMSRSWSTWHDVGVTMELAEGMNLVVLSCTGAVNVDNLVVA